MKDRRPLKIAAGILGIILIMGLLFVTNAFVGNPISGLLAKNAARKHVEENYPNLDLEIEAPVYNFKDGAYITRVYSKTSIDTHFNIYGRSRDLRDDYESNVGDRFNTFMRLGDQYTALVREIVADSLGYEDNKSWVIYSKIEYEEYKDYLELDMKFDRTLALEAEVSIDLELENPSPDKLAKIFEDIHKVFLKEDCIFYQYGGMIGDNKKIYNISDIKPEQIEGGNLLELLQGAVEAKGEEYEGISIFLKE